MGAGCREVRGKTIGVNLTKTVISSCVTTKSSTVHITAGY